MDPNGPARAVRGLGRGAGRPRPRFAALSDRLLDHLYVHPLHQGPGLGARLLSKAKERRPGGFDLWTFQRNEDARRFYERHRLRAVELTDGARNEEREPDVRYAWRP